MHETMKPVLGYVNPRVFQILAERAEKNAQEASKHAVPINVDFWHSMAQRYKNVIEEQNHAQ